MNIFKINIKPSDRPEHVFDYGGQLWATDGAGVYDLTLWPNDGILLEEESFYDRWIPPAELPNFGAMIEPMLGAPTEETAHIWRVQDNALILRGVEYYAFDVRFAPVMARAKLEIVRLAGVTVARCWMGDRVVAVLASLRSKVEGA